MIKITTLVFTLLLSFSSSIYAAPKKIQGYVDLHSHLMAEHMFGGSWFWGSADGHKEHALRRCDGALTGSHGTLHLKVRGKIFAPKLGYGIEKGASVLASEGLAKDTGVHLGKRRGYDNRRCKYFLGVRIPGTCPKTHFEGWPLASSLAHQQMWHGYLKKAFKGGLKVMVVSFTESKLLCLNTPERRRKYSCDEMSSVERQIKFLKEFVKNHSSWLDIAYSPKDVRSIEAQGKLALVMAVEVSELFPSGDFISQLDKYKNLGVRSMQIVHHANNRFSGAAPLPKLEKMASIVELARGEVTNIGDASCGKKCDGDRHTNEMGLTYEGNRLVNAMIDRGMLVDVAHVSRKALRSIYDIHMKRERYPLLYSHAHLWDINNHSENTPNEKYIKSEEFSMIRDTGGMVGLRTGEEHSRPVGHSVSNSCQGSIRSFAQMLMYGIDAGLNVGFGFDFHGFVPQMKPNCLSGGWRTEFGRKGLAHVGLVPEMVKDLSRVGVPYGYIDHIQSSAETFVQMWERAEGVPLKNKKISMRGPNSSTDGNFNLSWPEIDFASYYQMYISGPGVGYTKKITSPKMSIKNAKPGLYTYRVRPCNPKACGQWSSSKRVDVKKISSSGFLAKPKNVRQNAYTTVIEWDSVYMASKYFVYHNDRLIYEGNKLNAYYSGSECGQIKVRACTSSYVCSDWASYTLKKSTRRSGC